MSVTDDFTRIFDKTQKKRLMPFLQTLDKAGKKELVPVLKQINKDYGGKFINDKYVVKWTDEQRTMWVQTGFVCNNRKDFEQQIQFTGLRDAFADVLPWYCPDWFSDFINNHANNDFTPQFITYDWYLDMINQGYVITSPALIAKILPNYIFNFHYKKNEYLPQNLLKNDISLREHIWYMFDHESSLYITDRYLDVPEKSKGGLWITTFKRYVNEGKIDRQRLLKAALSASNHYFNQLSSGWFIELFNGLEPSKGELLVLQDDLFHVLNSPHSKPVNNTIKLFKDLALEPEFAIDSFFDHAPLLLASESKTTVSSALMILDKLAKNYKDKREAVTAIACQAFVHQDNDLQLRAAKLLQKYGDPESIDLKLAFATYQDALLFDSRSLLQAFLDDTESTDEDLDAQSTPNQPLVEITYPQTFDDLVFLASQAFDQNQPYHFDLLPEALLRFQSQITGDNIDKLTPALQRAYNIMINDFTSTMGFLDNMLASFFISYCQLLTSLHPSEAKSLRQVRAAALKKESDKKQEWQGYKSRLTGIKEWNLPAYSHGYKSHKHLLLNAFFLLERKIDLPLLSTPTHEPCWVSPLVLVQRLIKYKTANIAPADMDFQVAVSRCSADYHEEALELAARELAGEYRQIISFMLGGDYHPQETFKFKPVWLVAALTRGKQPANPQWFAYSALDEQHLTGNYPWASRIELFTYKKWDYTTRKNIDTTARRSIIGLDFGIKGEAKPSIIKSWLTKILPGKVIPAKTDIAPSVYNLTKLAHRFASAEDNDIMRFIYLNPNHPEVWLAQVIDKALHSPDLASETEKRMLIHTLEALIPLNINYGPMAHLLVASSMISSDKTIRAYAAELWIYSVNTGNISSHQIGDIIGRHQSVELSPFKRFTDLTSANMFQVSRAHNQALLQLLNACIAQLANKPINGLKKLLEIYTEVLSTEKNTAIPADVLDKLSVWETTDSLGKIVVKIKQLGAR